MYYGCRAARVDSLSLFFVLPCPATRYVRVSLARSLSLFLSLSVSLHYISPKHSISLGQRAETTNIYFFSTPPPRILSLTVSIFPSSKTESTHAHTHRQFSAFVEHTPWRGENKNSIPPKDARSCRTKPTPYKCCAFSSILCFCFSILFTTVAVCLSVRFFFLSRVVYSPFSPLVSLFLPRSLSFGYTMKLINPHARGTLRKTLL